MVYSSPSSASLKIIKIMRKDDINLQNLRHHHHGPKLMEKSITKKTVHFGPTVPDGVTRKILNMNLNDVIFTATFLENPHHHHQKENNISRCWASCEKPPKSKKNNKDLTRRFEKLRKELLQDKKKQDFQEKEVHVAISVSPGIKIRVEPIGRYLKGTLSPTSNQQSPQQDTPSTSVSQRGQQQQLLRAARDSDETTFKENLRTILEIDDGVHHDRDLNVTDTSGRTILSYVSSNGAIDLLELLLQISDLDPNKSDNEGNTPLHFAAQAGQVECLNCLLSRCRGVEIDARNNLGFTPLMKAALQGRNKCAKLLLFAGANPTLRDNGRGFRADQWARFCGRYVCADVIEKHARQRLLERSTSYGNWGLDHEVGGNHQIVIGGKIIPLPSNVVSSASNGLKSKLKKVFRTSSGPTSADTFSSARLITQLTSAALCASSPVLPNTGSVPPMVKSLLRPLTVPRLQITLANNNNNVEFEENLENIQEKIISNNADVVKPARNKKKK